MGVLRPFVLCLFAAAVLSACVYGRPYPATGAYYGSYGVYGAYPAYKSYRAYPGYSYGGYKRHKHHSGYGYYGTGRGCWHCGW